MPKKVKMKNKKKKGENLSEPDKKEDDELEENFSDDDESGEGPDNFGEDSDY